MGQWGKPYKKVIERNGRKLLQTWLPHYDSVPFTDPPKGALPDKEVLLDERPEDAPEDPRPRWGI